ncbi:TolC family protein [Pelagicoccus sp. SDUM812002]|uniref:TolC family protein n=1 Tax=Pelagicoccus sp. SDUM812002 TaxID=3041266 RepID=UPI00280FB27A|nr:TolC family protein [Pelagicoccus sp. SDUM812002]MDQ8184810.1 TolC family protein [Pelagicoccus sp. SDUM812002]
MIRSLIFHPSTFILLVFLGLTHLRADEIVPEEIDLPNLITLALQRDFQIRIVQTDKEIAAQNLKGSRGYWDPAVSATHSSGSLGGGGGATSSFNSQEGEVTSASIYQNVPTGGRLTLDAAAGRFENNFGSPDTYATNAGIALYQPLLKNFGAASRSFIKIAQRNYEQSEQSFRLQAITTVTDAITLYNQTALRKDSLRVAEQSRELASQLVADTRKRAELGTIEVRGVEVAETRLAQREANVVLQRRLYLDTLNELKRFVSNEALALVKWKVEIGPMPAPQEWSGDLNQDFEYALQNRPDYQQALIQIEKAIIDERTAVSGTLPELDLNARAFRTNFSDSFTSSYKGISSTETDLFVGVTFSRPILNRTASAERASARLFKDRAHLVEQQLQQAIAIQLDNAARRIESEAQSRELARQGREFAERSLEAEERKLNLGQSTTFFVLEAQEDLTAAQVRELEAIANYNIAVARYHQVKGSTLQNQAIDL